MSWAKALRAVLMGVAGVAAAGSVSAQDRSSDSLDKLLEQVRQGQQQSSQANREREARFLRDKGAQQRLLSEARAELAAIKRRTQRQKSDFDKTAREIAGLKKSLAEQTGDLEQLFGQIRTAAGDARAQVSGSLTSAQFPERIEFLAELANGTRPVQLRQLERLWFTYQQEIVEAGRVVTFAAEIIDGTGTETDADVTRVGVFTAVAGETYLDYQPASGRFQALARQPTGDAQALARAFTSASSGEPPMIIDPTRGSLLALLVDRPSLQERIAQGKLVGYVILALGAIGLVIAVFQGIYLIIVGAKVRAQRKRLDTPKDNNPLGRLLTVLDDGTARGDADLETLELRLDEGVIRETPRLERAQGMIKLLASVAPLLGLLGTVTGMIATFQSIMLFGTGDPRLMAGGISQALITTVLGLIVAIPLLFLHSLLATRSRSIVRVLDEQAAGLIARRIESRQGTAGKSSGAGNTGT